MRRIVTTLACVACAALLGACESAPPEPTGALVFEPPGEMLIAARPVEIDGRRIHDDELGRPFHLAAGSHRVTVMPANAKTDQEIGVTVEVKEGVRHSIALRESGGGGWEVIVWKESALQGPVR